MICFLLMKRIHDNKILVITPIPEAIVIPTVGKYPIGG